jgi:uncharacterized membrane protein YphA (DoxX/SURF4 family)
MRGAARATKAPDCASLHPGYASYFISHVPRNVFPIVNGGDSSILYCFIFLYLVFAGPGPWSLDAAWRRKA